MCWVMATRSISQCVFVNTVWIERLLAGEEATRMIIAEGRKVAEGLQGAKKGDLLRNCDEAEILCNQLSDLCRRGMVRL